MPKRVPFSVNQNWRVLLKALGFNVVEVLRRAQLPDDLFSRKDASLNTAEYFRLWQTMEQASEDSLFPLKVVQAINTDVFDPPIFAAYCSPDLNTALQRLSRFKPLIGPMKLDIEQNSESTRLVLSFLDQGENIPFSLIATEVGFFIQLARLATREHLKPIQITAPIDFSVNNEYEQYFGIKPLKSDDLSMTFSAEDAARPFVSENTQMWDFFEEGLNKKLSEVSMDEDFSERARSALLEMLPSGQTTSDDLARRLMVSKRTLQRRLGDEGTNFKEVLANVREDLAKHYITRSDIPYTQISFLLGYEDPNSFFRAFHSWTGSTPDSVRTQAMH
ncbi:MAG: AraC family transcriptional regulator ligand-binding domain-containing protein [Candidatus Thiodiazotropha sp.]